MRTGHIISYNKKAGVGCIKNVNNQRIRFFSDDLLVHAHTGDAVSFDISFRNGSLVAINIKLLTLS
ncbi:hypothetical protein [Pedobacter endophyticus]|uniref:Cold shock domain-containing protein n=1 Tax=Pedobacter endophyticus TaxID=2789740 RepID=A0A7S9KYS3_9SPHI|nr:hypothetical protein [Pedobacter endophyticus]QPH39343.1 hypothetical protein IZT61_20240 [Pedobacter endophyticus]